MKKDLFLTLILKKQSYLKQISREREDGVVLVDVENNKGVNVND